MLFPYFSLSFSYLPRLKVIFFILSTPLTVQLKNGNIKGRSKSLRHTLKLIEEAKLSELLPEQG
jgi:hypothetical protein